MESHFLNYLFFIKIFGLDVNNIKQNQKVFILVTDF